MITANEKFQALAAEWKAANIFIISISTPPCQKLNLIADNAKLHGMTYLRCRVIL